MDSILFLVRHGQCVANLDRDFAGRDEDDYLTALGVKAASATGRALVELSRMSHGQLHIVSSTLRRAEETSSIIACAIPGIARLPSDKRLIEKGSEELPSDVLRRVRRCLSEVRAALIGPLVVVTHGHVIQYLVSESLHMSHPEILNPSNCGITIMVGDSLVAYNSMSHLIDILREGGGS